MDTKSQPAADRVYEDFEPYYEWDRDEGSIHVLLPGYRRDQLKVQVTSKPVLKLMGERQITENIWLRFNIEFPILSDYDTDNVTAKFEGGRLHVKFAKLVKPKETTNPPEEAPKPKEPSLSEKVDEQKAAQEVTQKAKEDKAEARTNNEVFDQKKKEPSNEKEKSKTEAAASIDKMDRKKVKTNGLTETTEAVKPKETTNPPEEAPKPKEPSLSEKVDEQKAAQEVTQKAKEDKAEARTNNEVFDQKKKEPSNEKEKSKTEAAASIDKMDRKKVKTNGLTETTEAATPKAPETKDAKPVTRSKTRLLDFTLSLGPSNNRADMDNEALGDLDARLIKRKKMVKGVVLILLVVGLGLYARNALKSFHGGSEFKEL